MITQLIYASITVGVFSMSAQALTVHECAVSYHQFYAAPDGRRIDLAPYRGTESFLLSENNPSNIMLADESSNRERTDILAEVTADGAILGQITGPMGISYGALGKDGTFKNATGNVYGTLVCSKKSAEIDAVLRDEGEGSIFSIGFGSTRFAGALLGREMCYFGDADAAANEISLIPGALGISIKAKAVIFVYKDKECLEDNGVPYDGNVCYKWQNVMRSRKVKACKVWKNWRNEKFEPPQRP